MKAQEGKTDLSILIVGFNSLSHLGPCLESLSAACRRYRYEVLFTNNGSDGSEEWIGRAFPEVRIRESLGNVGYGIATNYLADEASGTWLFLLNPDTECLPGSIDELVEQARRHAEYGVFGALNIGRDGQPKAFSALQLPRVSRFALALAGCRMSPASLTAGGTVRPVEAVCGGTMLLRRDLWTQMGGFDPEYFLYADELDFFNRLKKRGQTPALITSSRIVHDAGSGDSLSPTRTYYSFVGTAHYARKHMGKVRSRSYIFLMWINALARYAAGIALASRKAKYRLFKTAFGKVALQPATWIRGYDSPGSDPRKVSARRN